MDIPAMEIPEVKRPEVKKPGFKSSEAKNFPIKTVQLSLYGRRKSRPLNYIQQELMEHLLPNLDVDIQEIKKAKHVILEIGFGAGEHLASKAVHNPETLCVGCEPFINGVANLLYEIDKNNIKNIRIHNSDVRRLYDELPDCVFDSIFLLYPDPWPKKRHWKRRFVQIDAFNEIYRLLKPNGHWYIATDHSSYQGWIEELLKTPNSIDLFSFTNQENTSVVWPNFSTTRYQEKAKREGRQPRYYVLKSKKES
jgi:tRNA (guanine-N7-)-methyltransferase